ncbi:MAG: ABC-2 transporter permease [Eubacteriales bacterium]|nr:ABC-2 transporter permease [Eubacteriales bacterium]
MLGRLIKYEFKATARPIVPVSLMALVLSIVAKYLLPILDNYDNVICKTFFFVGNVLFSSSFVALAVVTILIIIERFRKHVLGDEGYVTNTLPVTAHEIIWSKLIVFFVWMIFIAIIVALSSFIYVVGFEGYRFERTGFLFSRFFSELWQDLRDSGASLFDLILWCIECALMVFIMYASAVLSVYASIMLGQQLPKYKAAAAIVIFTVMTSTMSSAAVVLLATLETMGNVSQFLTHVFEESNYHLGAIFVIIGMLIPAAIYYFITACGMKNRLNLE